MQEAYKDFIQKIKHKKILFCGLGRSNVPLINMLAKEKINVTAYDSHPEQGDKASALFYDECLPFVQLRTGDEKVWGENFDILIRTPGMSFYDPKIDKMRRNGTAITSEMEIFFDLCPCPIIGVTGSDGKTTVTTLISQILKNEGHNVFLGGNIGSPLLPQIGEIDKNDIAVVELSSFQLVSMRKSPQIGVITNISPNHLDVHRDMQEYIDSKKNIFTHQTAFSKTILNFDNLETRKMSKDVRGEILFFSRKEKIPNGTWLNEEGDIIFSRRGKDEKIMNASEIKIPGNHNLENYLAAITTVKNLVTPKSIRQIANTFNGVEHRIEFVKSVNKVSYYNDSIASTPNRTINGALSLFKNKVILIAGGYDKKIPFDSLAKEIVKKVSVLILLGKTADKIEDEIKKLNVARKSIPLIIRAKDMRQAVSEAAKHSKPEDVVVLSPACASFDLYKNFEERGNDFKKCVQDLKIK